MYDDRFDRVTLDRDGDPVGEEETIRTMAEDDTEDLEQEELESAVEDKDDEDEEDEGEPRTVQIKATIKVDSNINLNELKGIIFDDVEGVSEVVDFDWNEV